MTSTGVGLPPSLQWFIPNLKLAQAPGNVLLPSKATGLVRDSVANVSQVITVDKSFLTERVGTLPPYLLEQVDGGLRLALSL